MYYRILLLLLIIVSCKKSDHENVRALYAGSISPCSDSLGTVTLSGNIIYDRTLSNDTVYYLDGYVAVEGVSTTATLTIEPGTLIRGVPGIPPSGGNPGTPGGVLVITKTGRIDAQGTSSCPIVFTSYREKGTPESGDFGGVVILGEAPTNTPVTKVAEGVTGNFDATYGGNIINDNSGKLIYVRIEYAGWEMSMDNELNGLTLAGVGNATEIRNVEVFKSRDDGFQFFGGTVNASHLVSIDALDDGLDFENGYVGTIDTALVLADVMRADRSISNGIESDNDATGTTVTPVTRPVIEQLTLVGVSTTTAASINNGAPSGIGRYGSAAHLRRATQFDIRKSICMGYNTGINMDQTVGNTYDKFLTGASSLDLVLSNAFLFPYRPMSTPPPNNNAFTSAQSLNIRLTNPYVRPSAFGTAANYFPANNINSMAHLAGAGAFNYGGVDWASGWVRFQ